MRNALLSLLALLSAYLLAYGVIVALMPVSGPLGFPVARIERIRLSGVPDQTRIWVDNEGGREIFREPAHWRERERTMRYTAYAAGDTLIGVAWAVQGQDGVWRGARVATEWERGAVVVLGERGPVGAIQVRDRAIPN